MWVAYFLLHPVSVFPTPRAFFTLPDFTRLEKPRWRLVELGPRARQSHGKIGHCEQSTYARLDLLARDSGYICCHGF